MGDIEKVLEEVMLERDSKLKKFMAACVAVGVATGVIRCYQSPRFEVTAMEYCLSLGWKETE